jgi:hypothetical protein
MEGPALDHLVCGEGRDAISLQVKGRGASSRAFDPAQDGCEPANPIREACPHGYGREGQRLVRQRWRGNPNCRHTITSPARVLQAAKLE